MSETTNRIGAAAASLEMGVIGNGSIGALVDDHARVVWCCLPRLDGDPAFCALLSPNRFPDEGVYAIDLDRQVAAEQTYLPNSALLRTVLRDDAGNAIEITDFAPRFAQYGRMYRPMMLVRRIRPLAGSPRVRVRLLPLTDYGERRPEQTWGSNHGRFLLSGTTLRLTTDVPVRFVRDALYFVLDREVSLVLGPDETLTRPVGEFAREAEERTLEHWRAWVRSLSVPFDWQDAVIRAAITLKMCQDEDTGAIIAAMTTSVPEAAHTERCWDYRYCWIRDAAFVVRALNRLGATESMEAYLRYIFNLASGEVELQPVYGIGFEHALHEMHAEALSGYRGMGPVRRGNDAWRQTQHDAYGSVVLASMQLFFDQRLAPVGGVGAFRRLEPLGKVARRVYDQPDAGLWEFRGRAAVHTYSAVMSWVACDRLARIGAHLGEDEAAADWRATADAMRDEILRRSWSDKRKSFVDAFEGDRLDASLLLLPEVGFLPAGDPRFVSTVDAIGAELRRGNHLYRYCEADDFGVPETSFNLCTFWYIDALAAIGRRDEARTLFDGMLARRTRLGLMSEDLDTATGEAWGNFPQTYSLVGLIHCAMRLSRRWEDTI